MTQHAEVITETLTDRSKVFNVVMQLADGCRVRFDCEDRKKANALASELNQCTDSSVQP